MALKIKTLDLMALGKLHKDYSGAWGLYHPEKDEIWLDKRLEKHSLPSRKEIEYHERCHRMIEVGGVGGRFTHLQEEAMCDLWAIYRYPIKRLSGFELLINREIFGRKTKAGQIRCMLRMVGVKPTKKLVEAFV